jgi:Holliday junction resolvase RusA-like endonuclease
MIRFTVYGEPVAQGRPKFAVIAGHARAYDPKKSRDYKDFVKLAAAEHAPKKLLEGPLSVRILVYRPIPKGFSKKKTAEAESGLIRPTTKPDTDNYLKGIKDALKNVMWKDDSQIVDVYCSKWYGQRPRVEVEISELASANQMQEKPAQVALF